MKRPIPSTRDLADQLTRRYSDREWAEAVAPHVREALIESDHPKMDKILTCNPSPFTLFRLPEALMTALEDAVYKKSNTLEHYRDLRNEKQAEEESGVRGR